jgi:hypothetical protein
MRTQRSTSSMKLVYYPIKHKKLRYFNQKTRINVKTIFSSQNQKLLASYLLHGVNLSEDFEKSKVEKGYELGEILYILIHLIHI